MTGAKEKPRPDADLMALLERSPQEGTAELFRLYAGLVWSVAEKYLDNPEDVKECVNDTFLEFYLHRERFRPEKGELKTWLAAIARNLAVSRFRKNASRETQELKEDTALEQGAFGGVERRLDLEQALEALPGEDADIIRMKYYGGMTVQEIAASLGLPFETVKKRHQRSLKKLRQMLTLGFIIALLAALLAACAYLVLRYFGIVPGYGVVTDPQEMIYTLAEPVAAEDYYGTYTVTEATLIEGTARIFVDIQIRNEDILRELDELERIKNPLLDDVQIVSGGVANWGGAAVSFDDLPAEEEGMAPAVDRMNWHVVYMATDLLPPEDGILTLRFSEQELTLPMKPAAVEEQKTYSSVLYERGGLLAIPRPEEDRLLMEIYPLNVGEYDVLPGLIRDATMQGKTGDITLTGEDGRIYTGEWVYMGQTSFSTWDFGLVEPGVYTLQVPYVYLAAKAGENEPNPISVNLLTGQWEDEVMELPCGTMSIVSFELIDKEDMPDDGQSGYPAVESPEDGKVWRKSYCHCVLHWESPAEDLEMYAAPVSIRTRVGGVWTRYAAEPLPDNCFEFWSEADEQMLDGIDYGDWEELLAGAALVPADTQSIRWNHAFEIPVTVE